MASVAQGEVCDRSSKDIEIDNNSDNLLTVRWKHDLWLEQTRDCINFTGDLEGDARIRRHLYFIFDLAMRQITPDIGWFLCDDYREMGIWYELGYAVPHSPHGRKHLAQKYFELFSKEPGICNMAFTEVVDIAHFKEKVLQKPNKDSPREAVFHTNLANFFPRRTATGGRKCLAL